MSESQDTDSANVGTYPGRATRNLPSELIQRMKSMYESGMEYKSIAEAVGCHWQCAKNQGRTRKWKRTPAVSLLGEEWRRVIPADLTYWVSNLGRGKRPDGRLMPLHVNRLGYVQVFINRGGIRKQPTIHKLIAEAFIGPTPPGHEVNHKDGNKQNNRLDNLEYLTHRENIRHAFATGLVKRCRTV